MKFLSSSRTSPDGHDFHVYIVPTFPLVAIVLFMMVGMFPGSPCQNVCIQAVGLETQAVSFETQYFA